MAINKETIKDATETDLLYMIDEEEGVLRSLAQRELSRRVMESMKTPDDALGILVQIARDRIYQTSGTIGVAIMRRQVNYAEKILSKSIALGNINVDVLRAEEEKRQKELRRLQYLALKEEFEGE